MLAMKTGIYWCTEPKWPFAFKFLQQSISVRTWKRHFDCHLTDLRTESIDMCLYACLKSSDCIGVHFFPTTGHCQLCETINPSYGGNTFTSQGLEIWSLVFAWLTAPNDVNWELSSISFKNRIIYSPSDFYQSLLGVSSTSVWLTSLWSRGVMNIWAFVAVLHLLGYFVVQQQCTISIRLF